MPAPCVICGGTAFEPGPSGRLVHGRIKPRCTACRSLERHRVLRTIYDAIPDRYLAEARCLQFAIDTAAPRERFRSFELSVFGADNSLDMMRIDRGDASYDWVVANHVIEHLANDLAGMAELLRIAGPEGIAQVTVPAPKARLETEVMATPDNIGTFHFHTYGSDFADLMAPALGGAAGIAAIGWDRSTETWDAAYFFSKSHPRVLGLGGALIEARLPVLRCA